jgi:hypothetical protein
MLDEGSVAELIDERENVISTTSLYAICRRLATKQSVSAKQPKSGLCGLVELMELIGEPLKGEQLLEFRGVRVYMTLLPARDGLGGGIQQLRDLAAAHSCVALNGIEPCSYGTRHESDSSF